MRIGLFDSGVGGLTVLKTLIKHLPNNEYIYFGDTLNNPYGNKTISELEQLADLDVSFLIKKKVDLIIIACGTVSSTCLSHLRAKYNIPIYDIISPTIDYLNKENKENIAILATTRTINSHIFKNNIKNKVIEIPSPKLVPLIESDDLSNISSVLKEYLNDYQDKIDNLVLGCTHYPIIKDYIESCFSYRLNIIDMSHQLLPILKDGDSKKLELYFTKLDDNIIKNTKKILENNDITILETTNK